MLTVDFSKYPGENIHEQQGYLIQSLLRPGDDVLAVMGNRDLLLKTSEEARAELKSKEDMIKKGLKPGERIVIKAFMHDEYLWIALESWEGGLLKGIVEAEPLVTRDVKAGDSIEVPFDRVFDYVHIKPDGSMEGNETGKLIERLQEEAREAAPKSEP